MNQMSLLQYPKLRWPLDVRLQKFGDKEAIILQCPLGITPQPLALHSAVAPLLQCFDGSLSVEQIAERFAQFGVTPALVMEIAELLEKHLFLATPSYFSAERNARESFRDGAVRSAALAGISYAAEPEALRKEVASYLSLGTPLVTERARSMVGFVAPHIDYRRGHSCYGRSYAQLPAEPRTYVLIGTSHQFSKRLFHLTKKDFATPLGTIRCHRDAVESIALRLGKERAFADEFLHRREHSLELQLPFLAMIARESTIIPILVGSFHEFVSQGVLPESSEEYCAFAEGLTELLRAFRAQGHPVTLLAGVDMAHVGRHFGDSSPLSPEFMETVRLRDQQYLSAIAAQDTKALFEHIASDNDARRICGFPTIYTVLDVLKRLHIHYDAKVFDYQQAVDYQSDCAVTFAGVGLYEVC